MFYLNQWKIKRLGKKIKSLQLARLSAQPNDLQLKKERACYYELAAMYKKLARSKKYPYAHIAEVECYKAAADLDDADAHHQVGQLVLNEAKFREQLGVEGVFNSQANIKRCAQLYEEAHAHLLAAEQLGHVQAKRLRGLAIINGWGAPIDKDAGFELVVSSIEQEGSWDKVPQIFAAMGLNKPEFFAAIMQRRKGS